MAKKVTTVDITEDSNKTTDPAALAVIVQHARDAHKLELEIQTLQRQIEEKSKKFNELMMVTLPERMTASGLNSFTLGNSYSVNIKEFINASIPTEKRVEEAEGAEKEVLAQRRKAAMAWLAKHKADSLIKNKLTAEFGKGEDKFAKKYHDMLTNAGFKSTCEESVNHNTLNAFIKEMMKKGVDVPVEPFALFHGKKAEIRQEKKKQ